MLRISKLSDYALLLMAELAQARDAGQPALRSAHWLAEASGVELPTASKVLKLLSGAGLVESIRGAAGGYRLARDAASISVADIIAAIDGPIAMTECSVEPGLCHVEDHCNLSANWQRISLAVNQALAAVSLAEMLQPLEAEQLKRRIPGLRIAISA